MTEPPATPYKPALRVVLCAPRGFCAGVVRAIDIVEQALRLYGAPVYVRHEIVHNKFVVDALRAKGVVFVKELNGSPGRRPAGDLFRPWRRESGARGGARREGSSQSTPPARSSPRCTAKRSATINAVGASSSSAISAIRK